MMCLSEAPAARRWRSARQHKFRGCQAPQAGRASRMTDSRSASVIGSASRM